LHTAAEFQVLLNALLSSGKVEQAAGAARPAAKAKFTPNVSVVLSYIGACPPAASPASV
jgi:hypothetical protein